MKRSVESEMPEKDEMRDEYDFSGGVRGKHYQSMQGGYSITIHHPDGRKEIREVRPAPGAITLAPDVRPYFPDSESVNTVLRTLIHLIPANQKAS